MGILSHDVVRRAECPQRLSAARARPYFPVLVLCAPLNREVQREASFTHFHASLSGDEKQQTAAIDLAVVKAYGLRPGLDPEFGPTMTEARHGSPRLEDEFPFGLHTYDSASQFDAPSEGRLQRQFQVGPIGQGPLGGRKQRIPFGVSTEIRQDIPYPRRGRIDANA